MGQVINTNTLSLLTQNNLNKSQASLNTAIQRLSSGLRINSAKDDAAGQAIANRFTSNIKGLTQSSRNANDGISMAQTTEGALGEINTNLQRIRELAVQSSNATNSDADKTSIQAEIVQRMEEIKRTSEQTDFNGTKVLNKDQSLQIQVGAKDGEFISIDLKKMDLAALGLTGFNVDKSGTANTAATQDQLTLKAAYTTGDQALTGSTTNSKWVFGSTDAQGTSSYVQTTVTQTTNDILASSTPRAAATRADVFAAAVAGTTVRLDAGTGINSYVATGAGAAAKFASATTGATTTNATVQSALIPTGGAVTSAVVTIGGTTQAIRIDSTGNVRDEAGTQLYLDTTGNLTQTNGGPLTEATIGGGGAGDLLRSMNNVTTNANAITQAGTIAVTTAGGSTITYAGGAGAAAGGDKWDYANNLTQADMQSKSSAASTSVVDILANAATATTYTISSTGSVKDTAGTPAAIFIDPAAAAGANLSTTANTVVTAAEGSKTTTTETYYVHSNGAVMDGTGNKVYADSDLTNPKGFTLTGRSGNTSTANPLDVLDKALSTVDKLRGALGAVQNRFDSVISNLGTTINNLTSSRSRIEDADYATEVSNMTRANILQQAGTSVLAQANQSTQGVLSLLR